MLVQRKHSSVKTRRREPPQPSPPPPPPSHRLWIVPRRPAPSTRARREPKEEVQGRFRRLTNKLAIIFHHHHHHHHHHLHAGEDEDKGQVEVKSIWKHLKAVLHLSRNEKLPADKTRRHGYLHVMIEGLLRHLWAMRWRRRRRGKKVASRRVSKRHRLWAWFRRRGGVVVGGRRRLRLRHGPSGSRRRMGVV